MYEMFLSVIPHLRKNTFLENILKTSRYYSEEIKILNIYFLKWEQNPLEATYRVYSPTLGPCVTNALVPSYTYKYVSSPPLLTDNSI